MAKLPDLPKQIKNDESDITPKVINWFAKNYPRSVALEIKVKGGHLEPHQPIALRQVQDDVFTYKLPDMGRRNPFDVIILKDADAFEVWCKGRQCEAKGYGGKCFNFRV